MDFQRRGQSAVEFLIVIGGALLMFVILLIGINMNLQEEIVENRNFVTKDIALTVQHEIKLAHESVDGYRREFELPPRITVLEYDIDIVDGLVYVRTDDLKHALSLPVDNVTGSIQKGNNIIRKQEGIVYLNQ